MENIKETIAKNLVELRKKHKYTQSALAEKLNYSDKAISRWERAETLPDIEILCKICDLYGVSFEYLLQKEQPPESENPYIKKDESVNKVSITLIAMCTVWLVAVLAFTYILAYSSNIKWTLFIWPVPICAIVGLVCNSLWKKSKVLKIVALSILNWSTLIALFCEGISYSLWALFLVGIPLQMIIVLSGTLKKNRPTGGNKE